MTAVVQGSDLQLDVHDANEPNILEPQHLPDTEVLAEGFRGCLQVTHFPLNKCWSQRCVVQMLSSIVGFVRGISRHRPEAACH